ncbi:fluoride efflux transporter CrcB [Consotaella salsifontis]|uniref:Fluoride-specific ion channel FluC n=1 Tax=Consotaella salsifontis TaxID=1365950 RepID=A0A1T4SYU5_9HYPH|nr:fluoride efflux transporter CrcB [Consotaella salsifontis]SKA33416.1 camphor resistance protein CrcB [Consotaella salsifontis]
MKQFFVVALGGGIGACLRHLLNMGALRALGSNFPYGTMAANVIGSFAMGVLVELLARRFSAPAEVRLFLTTGLLGGFTTFSTFSLDSIALYERGAMGLAALYVVSSVGIGLAALFAGLGLARMFV